MFYIPWYSLIKEAFNHPRYAIICNCKYFIIIGSSNNLIIINVLYDVTENVGYECNNQTIIDGNIMNMFLIIIELKYGSIDDNYSTYHGYYIIRFSLYTYNRQEDLNIYS